MNDHAIEVRGLRKTFAHGPTALDGMDLAVRRGSLFGLLGRNGAGKTTLLRVLMGLLRADDGEALVLGESLDSASRLHRARVAYVAQAPRLVARYTVAEHARLLAQFYPRFDVGYAQRLAQRFDVEWKRTVADLSGGARRKAAVCLAVATHTEVLLLDEPGAELDPVARRELIDVLVELLEGTDATVLLSTHLVADLERLADDVGIVDAGRTVRSDSLDRLKQRFRRVQVVFDDAPPAGFAVPGAVHTVRAGSVVTALAELGSEDELAPVRALPGVRVDLFSLGLEDLFVELVGPPREEARWEPAGASREGVLTR